MNVWQAFWAKLKGQRKSGTLRLAGDGHANDLSRAFIENIMAENDVKMDQALETGHNAKHFHDMAFFSV